MKFLNGMSIAVATILFILGTISYIKDEYDLAICFILSAIYMKIQYKE